MPPKKQSKRRLGNEVPPRPMASKKQKCGKFAVQGSTSLHLDRTIDTSVKSVFQQANASNPNPKSVGNVSDKHRILIVGDGDFSFALALATRLVKHLHLSLDVFYIHFES